MVNKILEEQFGELAAVIDEAVKWRGTAIEEMPTAYSVLASSDLLSDKEIDDALKFYSGNQWDEDVLSARAGRPTLTVNLLPDLLAVALDRQREAGLPNLEPKELSRLAAVITRRNHDAQQLYNYVLSKFAELLTLTARPEMAVIGTAEAPAVEDQTHSRSTKSRQSRRSPE